jgi:enoyl-CoA hydratase
MTDVVKVEREGSVLSVVIDRPEALNALNAGVLAGVEDAMARARTESGIRAVVLTGSGERAFCAGADLKEMQGIGVDAAREQMIRGHRVMRAVEQSPVPVIGAVNGLALGGGFELALSCTFTILSTKAALGLPESGLGLIPGYGGTQRLPRLVGTAVATHVMLTGERLTADRAYQLGLTPLAPVEPERLLEVAHGVAASIATKGPTAVTSILSAVRTGVEAPIEAGLAAELGLSVIALTGSESAEGIAAFLEKRAPRFGAGEAE